MAPGAPRPAPDPCSLIPSLKIALEALREQARLPTHRIADKGLYKLWRDGAGGYYTVEIEYSQAPRGFTAQLIFTCRANDSWDDLSDEC